MTWVVWETEADPFTAILATVAFSAVAVVSFEKKIIYSA
jgi:hypothetical protein